LHLGLPLGLAGHAEVKISRQPQGFHMSITEYQSPPPSEQAPAVMTAASVVQGVFRTATEQANRKRLHSTAEKGGTDQ